MKLKNLTFHATGYFGRYGIGRAGIAAMVEENGGVYTADPKECDYIVVGKDAMPGKLIKARGVHATQINYHELTMMIRGKPKRQSIFPEMQRLLDAN